jgi:hypothetical protein
VVELSLLMSLKRQIKVIKRLVTFVRSDIAPVPCSIGFIVVEMHVALKSLGLGFFKRLCELKAGGCGQAGSVTINAYIVITKMSGIYETLHTTTVCALQMTQPRGLRP